MDFEPVHVTEISTFLKCRLLWFWTAPQPRGLNLEPDKPGIPQAVGRLTHAALQEHYDFGVSSADAFGELSTKWLQSQVKEEKKWPGEFDEVREQFSLLGEVLEGYDSWAAVKDQAYRFLVTESRWRLRVAPRALLTGRYDAVVERSDGLWVLDFKTTGYDTADWTRQDLQATCYTMAARRLYGPDVRGLIFRFIKKKAPYGYDRLVLKSGSLTTRSNLANLTTLASYQKALAVATLRDLDIFDTSEECSDALEDPALHEQPWYEEFKEGFTNARRLYWQQISELRDARNPFFWEVDEYRTPAQVDNYKKYAILPAMKEMYSKRKGRWIGPTGLGTAWSSCGRCPFRTPCKLCMDGADFRSVLEEDYRQRVRD